MKTKLSFKEVVEPYLLDPELFRRLPSYPKIPTALKVYEISNETLLIITDNNFTTINGKNVFQRVTPIIFLLDGCKNIDSLIEDNPHLNKMAILGVIAFLYSKNFLERGDKSTLCSELKENENLSNYFGYMVSKNGHAQSRGFVYSQLSQKKVGIINCEELILNQFILLKENVSSVKDSLSYDLFVIINYDEKNTKLAALVSQILHDEKPVFFLSSTQRKILIGPMVIPGYGVTPGCFCDFLRNASEGIIPFSVDYLDISIHVLESIIISFFSLNMEHVPISSCLEFKKPTALCETEILKIPVTHYWTSSFGWVRNDLIYIAELNEIFNYHVSIQQLPPLYRSVLGYEKHYYPNNKKLSQKDIPLFPKLETIYKDTGLLEWMNEYILPVCYTVYSVNQRTGRSLCPSGGNIKSALLFVSVYNKETNKEAYFQYDPYSNEFIFIDEFYAYKTDKFISKTKFDVNFIVLSYIKNLKEKYFDLSLRISLLDAGVLAELVKLSSHLHKFKCKTSFVNDEEEIKQRLHLKGNDTVYIAQIINVFEFASSQSTHLNLDKVLSIDTLIQSSKSFLPTNMAPFAHSLNIRSPEILYEMLSQREAVRNLSTELNISSAFDIVKATLYLSQFDRNTEIKYLLLHKENNDQRSIYTIMNDGSIDSHEYIAEHVSKDILMQDNLSQASCIVFIIVNLKKYLYQYGALGYRAAIMEAGEKIIDIWLSCITHGLVGCPCGGFSENSLLPYGIDGYSYIIGGSFVFGEALV